MAKKAYEKSVRKYLRALDKAGVNFSAFRPGYGEVYLSPKGAMEFLDVGEDAYWAKLAGIDEDDYLHWKNNHADGVQCSGATSNGAQCKRLVPLSDTPDGYIRDVYRYCPKHA